MCHQGMDHRPINPTCGITLASFTFTPMDEVVTLEIVATCAGLAGAAEALQEIAADVLAIEFPTLQTEAIATVEALARAVGARHVVIEYRFAPSAVVGALRDRGFRSQRATLGARSPCTAVQRAVQRISGEF